MTHQKRIVFRACIMVLALVAASAMFTRNKVEAIVSPGVAPANPTCYPSCPPNDARFFSLAGSNLFTFAGGTTTIGLRVRGAGSPANFTVGIFDGDTNASGAGLWDQNTMATAQQTTFDLFADANNDGVEDGAALEQLPGASMLDDAWAYFNVPTHAAAFNATLGDYFYLLKVSLVPPFAGLVQNNFKILADSNQTQLFITPQVLSFQAFQNIASEFLIIHPSGNVDEVQPSNYNGVWNFSFLVDPTATSVNVFDGDLDIGSVGQGSALDTNDITTPDFTPDNAAFGALAFTQPMTAGINPEGVGTTGTCVNPQPLQACPPDDSNDNRFRRRSSIAGAGVVTRLIPPAGTTFTNNNPADIQVAPGGTSFTNINPSGTNEWELFRVATNAGPLAALNDVTVATLDLLPGSAPELWTYQIEGMDLANLFALRFDRILLVEPFMVGDTVFCDADLDGVQDPGDTGVPGVLVELVNPATNAVLKTTTTNASGFYSFVVDPGNYKVRIAASNFNVGGPLDGKISTTGGNEKTDTVVNANVLTYDFGYNCIPPCLRTIGDLVWEDLDGDGFRDAGEPGIGGVTVNLLLSATCNGTYIAVGTTTTNASGAYNFANLPSGCYRVDVSTPAGFTKTTGANPGQNNNSQADPYDINATECADNLTADFGYQRSVATCPTCSTQSEILVDTPIKLDAANLAATAGVLAPFATYAGGTITIDLKDRSLHVTSTGSISVLAGAGLQPPQFHQSGNHGTPNLTIMSTCTLLIDESVRGVVNNIYRSITGVIETNAQGGKAGDILLMFDGAITINGGVQSFQEKLPDSAASTSGAITIKSLCGEIREGPKGWVVTWGENPGTKPITFIQLGDKDIVINGLVMNRTNHTIGGNLPPKINLWAVGGNVLINGSNLILDEFNLMGTKYDFTSGVLTISREAKDVGKIDIQAFKDVIVTRNLTVGALNRTSFAAVATAVNSASPIGGTIRVRSLDARIVAYGRAFQADGRGDNSKALIELWAKGLVWMQTPPVINAENTPTVTTSAQTVNGVGKAGMNILRSCSGIVAVDPSAAVLATGVSNTGVNQLTGGGGVFITGTVNPAPVGGAPACILPSPIFP